MIGACSSRALLLVSIAAAEALLGGGCALTTSALGLGRAEPPKKAVECSAGRPLARATSIGRNLLASGDTGATGGRIALENPVSVAAEGTRVLIADAGRGRIVQFDRATETARVFADFPGLDQRASIYLDRALSLYVADPGASSVTEFDLDGRLVRTYSDPSETPQPIAVVVDERRAEILVADRLVARILAFNRLGGVTRAIGAAADVGPRFEAIGALALRVDSLYVVDTSARRVHLLSAAGVPRYTFGEQLVAPHSIAADSYNRVFVADNGDATIKVFQGGQQVAVVGAAADPEGLGFSLLSGLWESDDLLYVADSGRGAVEILRIQPPCP